MKSRWRPLLSGDEVVQVMSVVRDIAVATSHGSASRPENVQPRAFPAWQVSLDGRAGQSLLHAYLAFQGTDDDAADTAIRLLDEATDAVATLRLPHSLFFGFSGIAWAGTHLSGRLFEESEDGWLAVDGLLLQSLSRSPWKGKFDLFEGLVGLGVYALERLPRPSAVSCLEAVVAHLDALAERGPQGACFFSPPEALYPPYPEIFPQGVYNLGMSHGLAGVIALLGAVCQAGVAVERARPLLQGTVSWLLAHECPDESDFRFPHVHLPGASAERCRLAWCHGDLGVALALHAAALGAGESSWEGAARRTALAAAARSDEDMYVRDAGLCHGAAGAGHFFNRLYQATGEAALGEAARFWLRRALELREPGLGIAGYRMSQKGGWFDHPGLRVGASGVGLALLAAVSDVEPAWDRVFLASPPSSEP